MEITIKVEAAELVEAINNLAQAMKAVGIPTQQPIQVEAVEIVGESVVDEAQQDVDAEEEKARKLAEMDAIAEEKKKAVAERKKAAAAKKKAAEEAAKKAAEEAAADDDDDDPLAEDKPSYSKEKVREMLADFSSENADGTKRMKAALKKLGARKFSEVDEKKYPALLEELELI